MAQVKTRKRFAGVSRDQRVRIEARRDDARTFRQRLADTSVTTVGTLGLFGGLAFATLFLSWAPFIPELLFATALTLFLSQYRFKRKRWSLPLRVPRYLNKVVGSDVLDATTGKRAAGNIYLGMDEEKGEEVWANTDDLNKHALIIGTTGSGKTEAIMGQTLGFLALGSGGLIVDGKASTKTLASAFKIARLLGRDADLLTMDYLTGGIDMAGLQAERRSNTYNPLGFGGPAQKSETMVSLLDGDSDIWMARAITFLENVMPPLSFLSDRGYVVLNPKLLGNFSVLEVVENLIQFGLFRDMHKRLVFLREPEFAADWAGLQERAGGIKTYLEGLPGYATARPPKPHRTGDMSEEEWQEVERRSKQGGAAMDPAARVEVNKQHGYIQMQLTRSLTNLSENYGFIYNTEKGEIDYRDMVLNRRLMVVLLPALERSPQNLMQLGTMTTLSLKAVLGAMLNTKAEGSRREIIDGNPAEARVPFLACLDEVGAYMNRGLNLIPAQARSLGVSVYFGTQSISDLMKVDENEGKAILDNTALKMFGRLTSDAQSDTARTAIQMGGEVHVQVADEATFNPGATALGRGLTLGRHSGLQTHDLVAFADLARQENGEFHVIVGTHDTDERGFTTGGNRVTRALAFFTGAIPEVEDWRRAPFCVVPPPPKREARRLREAEVLARTLREGLARALSRPSPRLRARVAAHEAGTLGLFLAHRRAARALGAWPQNAEARARAVEAWAAEQAAGLRREAERRRLESRLADWRDDLAQDLAELDLPAVVERTALAQARPWQERAMGALGPAFSKTDPLPDTIAAAMDAAALAVRHAAE